MKIITHSFVNLDSLSFPHKKNIIEESICIDCWEVFRNVLSKIFNETTTSKNFSKCSLCGMDTNHILFKANIEECDIFSRDYQFECPKCKSIYKFTDEFIKIKDKKCTCGEKLLPW